MADRYIQHTFPNGLTLLGEAMPGMQSAAMTLMLPAGSATDPVDRLGSATVLSDLVLRGAGPDKTTLYFPKPLEHIRPNKRFRVTDPTNYEPTRPRPNDKENPTP